MFFFQKTEILLSLKRPLNSDQLSKKMFGSFMILLRKERCQNLLYQGVKIASLKLLSSILKGFHAFLEILLTKFVFSQLFGIDFSTEQYFSILGLKKKNIFVKQTTGFSKKNDLRSNSIMRRKFQLMKIETLIY